MQLGGQAVMEGVMMRNQERYAVAVRLPSGRIKVKTEKNSAFPKAFDFFFVRGIVTLAYTLYDGVRALVWSGNQQLGKEEKLTPAEIIWTLLGSLVLTILIFIILPFLFAHLVRSEGIWFNLLDGAIRVILFLGYLWVISQIREVKILFRYHGAEHKAIAAYEAKEKLTPEKVKKYSRFHPRCGTSFLFVVLLLSILVFSLLSGAWWIRLGGRILLIPVIAGIGYELIKFGGRHQQNRFVKVFIAPGLWLQRLTTEEPNEKQIEVGIVALKSALK